jgi:hypothetical protein
MSSDYNRPNYPDERTPVKSIRFFCLDCVCGQSVLVKECPDGGCALHPFRTGHNPNIKGREGNTDGLRKYWEGAGTP